MSNKRKERILNTIRISCLVMMAFLILFAFRAMNEFDYRAGWFSVLGGAVLLGINYFTFWLEERWCD